MVVITFIEVIKKASQFVKGIFNKIIFVLRTQLYDMYYYPLGFDEFARILKKWKEEKLPKLIYVSERFDCDDFAACFQAFIVEESRKNACGRAFGSLCIEKTCGGHAWNFVLVETKKGVEFICIEPQLGELVPCTGESFDKFRYNLQWIIG